MRAFSCQAGEPALIFWRKKTHTHKYPPRLPRQNQSQKNHERQAGRRVEERVESGGGRLIGHEKIDVKTRTTSQRWADVKMSGCVFWCSLRHFFFLFFLIGPLPVPAHFIFSRCPFVFMLGVSVSGVTFCLVRTWNGDVKGML